MESISYMTAATVHRIRYFRHEDALLFSAEDVAKAVPFGGDYGQEREGFFGAGSGAFVASVPTSKGVGLTAAGVHDLVDYAILAVGVRTPQMQGPRHWFVNEGLPRAV